MAEDDVPTPVFSGPYAEVVFLQTLLESAGIATSTDDFPGGPAMGATRLFVRHADAEHARELVEDFRKNGHRTAY